MTNHKKHMDAGVFSAVPHLARLSWQEAEQAFAAAPIVLLPIGSTEAHGPHLPLSTDVIISEGMAERAARQLQLRGLPVLVLPTLSYGVTEFARTFAGTIGIAPDTLRSLLRDIVVSIQRQGARAICLINSHLEPEHLRVLREVSKSMTQELGMPVLFPDKTRRRWVATLTEEFQQGACHAGRYETSLVLANHPECVRENRRTLAPLPINLTEAMQAGATSFVEAGASLAYFGDPATASGEEGERIYEALALMVVQTVLETLGLE